MRTSKEEKIIKLALQGLSNNEIAQQVDLDMKKVGKYIQTLSKLNHPNYDIETFHQIQMAKHLNHRTIVDKDFIDDIVNLVFSGFTFAEIALLYDGYTENSLKSDLSYALVFSTIYQDQALYQKVMKKHNDTITRREQEVFERLESLERNGMDLNVIKPSQVVEKFQFKRKVRDAILEYVDSGMTLSDSSLETKYQFYFSFISKLFSEKSYESLVLETISIKTLTQIKTYRKAKGLQNVKETHNETMRNDSKNLAEKEKISKKMNLWVPIMITFQLSIEDLAILTNFSDMEQLKQIVYVSANRLSIYYPNALDYILTYKIATNEEERKKRRMAATQFLKELGQAQLTQNKQKQENLMNFLMDLDVIRLLAKKIPFNKLTENEIRRMIEYRNKYAISYQMLPYEDDTLRKYCPPDLQEELEQVSEFNYEKFSRNHKGPKRA